MRLYLLVTFVLMSLMVSAATLDSNQNIPQCAVCLPSILLDCLTVLGHLPESNSSGAFVMLGQRLTLPLQ